MKTQNAHHCVHKLPLQEAAWGASYQYKDGWQEESVRDVTKETKDRAKRLPEALFAQWYTTKLAADFWTSAARGDQRLYVHNVARTDLWVEERQFARLDRFPPMDDSMGRCLQTWTDPKAMSYTISVGAHEVQHVLDSIQPGQQPTQAQCQAVLMHYFREHTPDPQLPLWHRLWKAENNMLSHAE